MANTTISALTAATAVDPADVLPIVQSATTKKSTIALLPVAIVMTSASAARPTGATLVIWRTTTSPTNIATGDIWVDSS